MADHAASIYQLLPAVAAAVVIFIPGGEMARANSASDNPFGEAVQVADARLNTMRGGFEFTTGEQVAFGIDVAFQSTELLNGVPQTCATCPAGIKANFTVTNGLNPSTPLSVTLNGINTGPVGSTIGSGATSVTTTLTNQAVVTIIQDTKPNTTLLTEQLLNVQLTGLALKSGLVGGGRVFSIFH